MQTHQNHPKDTNGFYGLGIAPALLEILARFRFTTPTPIQERSIPLAIEGQDVIGVAATGTGKTLAFGIPMLQRLAQSKGRGLVVVPTRELALQVEATIRKIGQPFGLRTAVLIGGASMGPQVQAVRSNPHVIIATPGRLNDHLRQRTFTLSDFRILVLDEADRMLDMGFYPQIRQIMESFPKERQTMLFSATIPAEIMKIAKDFMKLPVHIEIAPSGTTAERVTQEIFIVEKNAKLRLLAALLKEHRGSTLVFSRTKYGAKRITKSVREMGERAAEIHSDRSLGQRREALEGFRSGRYRVLIATDIAARGIDVTQIELVVNYDLPSQAEDYVHRIGRTARAGRSGHAVSFAEPLQRNEVRAIERLIRKTLPVSKPPAGFAPSVPSGPVPQSRAGAPEVRTEFAAPRPVFFPGRNRNRRRFRPR